MPRVRVLLADDQSLFREGLRTLLEAYPEIEVVGEAANGRQAIEACHRLDPDVVLMDLRMPEMGGAEATRQLTEAGHRCRVIVLTTFDDDEIVFEALRAGAAGYLLKDVDSAKLVDAVQAAARGESFLQPAVAKKVVAEFARLSRGAAPSASHEKLFSERELEVLRWVARGASNKEIAAKLRIAEGTVKNHMTSILGKLGVDDRTRAALRAREMGIL